MSKECHFADGGGVHPNKFLCFEGGGLLRAIEEWRWQWTVEQQKIFHFRVQGIVPSVPRIQNIVQVESLFHVKDWRGRITEAAGSMLQMLEPVRDIAHIPVNPIAVEPVAQKIEKAR